MPTKIRLQRHGKKGKPFFHIVVADGRAPRDGRFIERIGSYNPISNPATIDIDTDRAADWMMKGAQPTDTTRAILSYKGVLYRVHLNKGVEKGKLTQEQADAKFEAWLQEKAGKIESKKKKIADSKNSVLSTRLENEAKVNAARLEERKRKEAEATLAANAAVAASAEEAPASEDEAAPAEGEAPAEA
ncbi:MAG: 30S ribosomal protein S16 [Bacteroidia bacterium]|nr:30S ribosomal protein S16 [Bacteroidia bacterium]